MDAYLLRVPTLYNTNHDATTSLDVFPSMVNRMYPEANAFFECGQCLHIIADLRTYWYAYVYEQLFNKFT